MCAVTWWQSGNANEIGAVQHRDRLVKAWKWDLELIVGTLPLHNFLQHHLFLIICSYVSYVSFSFCSFAFILLIFTLRPDPDLEELQRLDWWMCEESVVKRCKETCRRIRSL